MNNALISQLTTQHYQHVQLQVTASEEIQVRGGIIDIIDPMGIANSISD